MFSFPNLLNEKAARVVAGVVAVAGVVVLLTGAYWLLVPMAYGFWARVLTGPTLSPLGRLASGVIAPRLGPPKYVAGAAEALRAGDGRGVHDVGRGARPRVPAHRGGREAGRPAGRPDDNRVCLII